MFESLRTRKPNVSHGGRLYAAVVAAALAVVAPPSIAPAAAEGGYTLEQCYRLALDRSKVIAGQAELIRQAEERVNQTRAAFFPSVSLSASALRQEAPSSPLAQNIFPADQETVKATAAQNLFKGFRDMATLRQRKLARRAAEFAHDQAEVQLFMDVAQAFYDALARQGDLANYREEIAANNDRRRELLGFKRAARAREADIATVEAALATLEATSAGARGLLDVARETLSFLTGLPRDVELLDVGEFPAALPALGVWLARIDQRPDVREARSNVEAADENIEAARAGRRPSVDLSANYYFRRPGLSEDSNWDVLLSLTQPIFTGGLVRSQVQEAVSQRRANELTFEQARDAAGRDIRSLYATLRANLDQAARLDRAVELARRNYELLRSDNRAGLASNLDVLQALANFYQTRRASEAARYTAKSNYARLRAISAQRTEAAEPAGDPAAAPGMPQ